LLLTLLPAVTAQFNPKAEEAKLRALLADYTPPLPYTKDAIRWSGATPAPVIPGQPRVAAYASACIGARKNERDKETIDWIEFSAAGDFAYVWASGTREDDIGQPAFHRISQRTSLLIFKRVGSSWEVAVQFIRPTSDTWTPSSVYVAQPVGWEQLRKPASLSPASEELWNLVEKDPKKSYPDERPPVIDSAIYITDAYKTPKFGAKPGIRFPNQPGPDTRTNNVRQIRIIRQEVAASGDMAYNVYYSLHNYDQTVNGATTHVTRTNCALNVWKKIDGVWRVAAQLARSLDGDTSRLAK
jgi:ketosteroid isomerase-like protein